MNKLYTTNPPVGCKSHLTVSNVFNPNRKHFYQPTLEAEEENGTTSLEVVSGLYVLQRSKIYTTN